MGEPIEGVLVLLGEDDHQLLENAAVDPATQGQGSDCALVELAAAEARRRGHREIRRLAGQIMAEDIAVCRRTGWHETARGERNGYARVFFRKPVGPRRGAGRADRCRSRSAPLRARGSESAGRFDGNFARPAGPAAISTAKFAG